MTEKQVNVQVDNGQTFFAHEMSINFSPLQFVFDFRNVTPRVDLRSRMQPVLNIKHNVVLVDPYHAKRILGLLTRVIDDYEKKFGKIKKPKALEKAEKLNKEAQEAQQRVDELLKRIEDERNGKNL